MHLYHFSVILVPSCRMFRRQQLSTGFSCREWWDQLVPSQQTLRRSSTRLGGLYRFEISIRPHSSRRDHFEVPAAPTILVHQQSNAIHSQVYRSLEQGRGGLVTRSSTPPLNRH